MNRRIRRSVAAALAVPATTMLAPTPPAPAATVLAVEGVAQAKGTAQTAFGGAFCTKNTCRSIDNARTPLDVARGSRQIQAAVDSTPGDIVVMGYSLGAASVYDRLRAWNKNPGQAPSPSCLKLIVTFGNPENKFGGDDRTDTGAGLPPTKPYQHLDVTMQYDSVADRPARFGWYSMMNNAFAQHLAYFGPVNINDPENLIYRDADGSTYMLIKARTLPMLQWMDWFSSDEQMAAMDAKYRPLIEKDYDRPPYVPQGAGADWANGTPPPGVANAGAQSLLPAAAAQEQTPAAAVGADAGRRTSGPRHAKVEDDSEGSEETIAETVTAETDDAADRDADANVGVSADSGDFDSGESEDEDSANSGPQADDRSDTDTDGGSDADSSAAAA